MQIVCGNWGIGLWARPEAKRRQAYLDKRRRGKYFDVLMQQADEARTRVREGTKWQVVPHQVARRAAGFKLSCGFELSCCYYAASSSVGPFLKKLAGPDRGWSRQQDQGARPHGNKRIY